MANFRRHPEIRIKRKHVSLYDDWNVYKHYNHYLPKANILSYPESVLFRISRVCHVTGESGLRGIIGNGGFRQLNDNFLWFSLYVTRNEISSAERRFLRWSLEDEYHPQRPLLEKFTTSPAFQSEFSIDQEELLDNVSVCAMTRPNLLMPPDTPLTRNVAEEILEDLRYGRDYQMYY